MQILTRAHRWGGLIYRYAMHTYLHIYERQPQITYNARIHIPQPEPKLRMTTTTTKAGNNLDVILLTQLQQLYKT